jgi:transcriptional regulator with AAA-type ATPase domain
MNTDTLHQTLFTTLLSTRAVGNAQELDNLVEKVVLVITEAINQVVSVARASPRSIPIWTPEIKEA